MSSEFWFLRRKEIPFCRALFIVSRRAWLSRQARKARAARALELGGTKPRADVRRIVEAHTAAIRAQVDGCLVFFAGLSLILLAFIIAGMR